MSCRLPFVLEYSRKHGYMPLDRIEQLCREHALYDYDSVVDYLCEHDEEEHLFGWVIARCGIGSRIRGINVRAAKARREAASGQSDEMSL